MNTLKLNVNVSDEVLAYLQREATTRKLPLDTIVSEVVAEYFDDPTEEQILNSMRQSIEDFLAGNVRPIDEVLAELRG